MKVPFKPGERSRFSSSKRDGRFGMMRSLSAVALRVERILERLEQIRKKVLNALVVEYGAVAGSSRRSAGLGERLELLRHVERIATELAHGFDALAKGREDVGDLRYGKWEVSDVDCEDLSEIGQVRLRKAYRGAWYRKR